MPVFTILVILATIILWLLLSPLFSKIGGSVIRKIRNIFQSEERKENEDVEKKKKIIPTPGSLVQSLLQ